MRKYLLLLLTAALIVPAAVRAADDEAVATTASDPNIPKAYLQLLVKPLTKEELKVEADAWFKMFRNKVQEISEAELNVKIADARAERAKEEAKEKNKLAEKAKESESADGAADSPSNVDADATAEAAQEAEREAEEHKRDKKTELERINELRDERIAIGDRLSIVLDELEKKGGERKEYDTYISSVTTILDPTVDVSDYDVVVNLVMGWLKSPEGGIRWGLNILKFVMTILAFWVLSKIIGKMLKKSLKYAKKMSELLRQFAEGFVRRAIFFVGLLVAVTMLEVNIGPLLAVIGAAGFVIGFALQGTLSNFASGLMILAYRPFDVKDVIDAGGVSGTVESLNLVSTNIRTFDNRRVIVPNNAIWGDVITNVTGTPTRRVDLVFGIGYGDDMKKARSILEDILGQHEKVLKEPAPVVRVHELADSSVNLICRPWVRTADYWDVYWDVTITAKERFDSEGISIPFPQRDVHVHQLVAASEESVSSNG